MEELTHLLRNRQAASSGRTWSCADEARLAAYVDGGLEANARRSLESHLADCPACRQQVSFVMQATDWETPADAPGWLVNKARELVPETRGVRVWFDWRWATASTAAILVLGLMAVLAIRSGNPEPTANSPAQAAAEPTKPAQTSTPSPGRNAAVVAMASSPAPRKVAAPEHEPPAPVVRNDATGKPSPNILAPREGALVKRAALTVRWQTVTEAVFYEVSIKSPYGGTLMSRQTEAASLEIPADVHLTTGTKYFVSIRAHLRNGKTARSGVVPFRVSD